MGHLDLESHFCWPYLPAAKMVPLADPKVEMATESGMIHENMPKILFPKVWNKVT